MKETLSANDKTSIVKTKIGGKYANYLLCLLAIATFLLCINYLIFDTLYIKCVIKELTGYDCPACGVQRAIVCIFKGEVVKAFWFNPYLAFIMLVFSLLIIPQKSRLSKKVLQCIVIMLVLLMIVWVVVRNLPIWHEFIDIKLAQ